MGVGEQGEGRGEKAAVGDAHAMRATAGRAWQHTVQLAAVATCQQPPPGTRNHPQTTLRCSHLLVAGGVRVHLVHTHNQLLHAQQVEQARVLAGLALDLTSLVGGRGGGGGGSG